MSARRVVAILIIMATFYVLMILDDGRVSDCDSVNLKKTAQTCEEP